MSLFTLTFTKVKQTDIKNLKNYVTHKQLKFQWIQKTNFERQSGCIKFIRLKYLEKNKNKNLRKALNKL